MSSSHSEPGVLYLVAAAGGLRDALVLARDGDAIALVEDAAPLALAASTTGAALDAASAGVRVRVLAADLAARGLAGKPLRAGVERIDYAGLVDLAVVQRTSVSLWK